MNQRLKAFACISSDKFTPAVQEVERNVFAKETYLVLLSDTVVHL